MRRKTASVLGFMTLIVSVLSAQAPGPETFGTDDHAVTVIGYQEFFPEYSTMGFYAGSGERSSSLYPLQAGINTIPNGAVLRQVVFYVRDNDAGENLDASLCRTYVDSASGSGNPLIICLAAAETSGSPGATYVLLNVDVPIVYRADISTDGEPDVVNYFLRVRTPGNTAIRMARLRWERQVSLAPATATFGDVPANHQFFQFVEALADSGITAGCSAAPPLYCPDAPLTRGQMAAFLAKALGLHWPWDAP